MNKIKEWRNDRYFSFFSWVFGNLSFFVLSMGSYSSVVMDGMTTLIAVVECIAIVLMAMHLGGVKGWAFLITISIIAVIIYFISSLLGPKPFQALVIVTGWLCLFASMCYACYIIH